MISIEYALFIGWTSAVVSFDRRRRLIADSLAAPACLVALVIALAPGAGA